MVKSIRMLGYLLHQALELKEQMKSQVERKSPSLEQSRNLRRKKSKSYLRKESQKKRKD